MKACSETNTAVDKTVVSDKVHVAIIGGGLAGLNAAQQLYKEGVDFQIFEADNRLGGRIASVHDDDSDQYAGDLGATWVWPAYQPHVTNGLNRLELATYPQYEKGHAVFDTQLDQAPQHQYLPGQHGIARIVGGPQAMIDAIVSKLPDDRLNTNWVVNEIKKSGNCFTLSAKGNKKQTVTARFIIIAAPIRLVAETILWNGLLGDDIISIMRNTPTWMATQAKVLITYTHAFWREQGLSGRVASQLGPMGEVHDHCGIDGHPASLFGFIGWSAKQRREADLRAAIEAQIKRCFGPEAAAFTRLTIKDWARHDFICSERDLTEALYHPQLIDERIRRGFSNESIFIATAETATRSPGLLDGAFEAGERAATQLLLKIRA